MNLHQVLTGAVNPGDNCFSVGSVNNVPFTAYASGCDVVVLGSNFERLQIIPGAKHGNIQVGCVNCSQRGGQVRIQRTYKSNVFVVEMDIYRKLSCQWQKTGQFVLESMVRNLAWHPTGTFTHLSVMMLKFRASFLKMLNQLFKSYLQLADIYFY
uniref:IPT/TIG domain-containing protein n=1 Tax=Poecilia latipinna TaxID=48699 RepID=A0A3B3VRK2_9TELE